MTHGSLFSGIGGFELAAEWSGFTNVFSCEIEPFNQRVLKHYWPNSELHTDVKEFPASDYTGRIDILTGGFPCQPYSTAGKRLGKEDDRHLWPFMLEIIREIAPTYVVGENVRGLVNWSDGLVFEEVQADMESEGYEVVPFVLPAAGVGAPHQRDRVWFVANTNNSRLQGRKNDRVIDASEPGRNEQLARRICSVWEKFPTQPPVCGGNDGLPRELDGITFSKWRNQSIKAYGNAIVPQVAYQIFQTIKQMHND